MYWKMKLKGTKIKPFWVSYEVFNKGVIEAYRALKLLRGPIGYTISLFFLKSPRYILPWDGDFVGDDKPRDIIRKYPCDYVFNNTKSSSKKLVHLPPKNADILMQYGILPVPALTHVYEDNVKVVSMWNDLTIHPMELDAFIDLLLTNVVAVYFANYINYTAYKENCKAQLIDVNGNPITPENFIRQVYARRKEDAPQSGITSSLKAVRSIFNTLTESGVLYMEDATLTRDLFDDFIDAKEYPCRIQAKFTPTDGDRVEYIYQFNLFTKIPIVA
jgi:hypothetical protein